MMRPAIVLFLLLSTAVMMRGVASDWRQGPPVPVEVPAKKGATPATAPLPRDMVLQPKVPGDLPNLSEGYLFNQERMLAGEEPPPSEEEDPNLLDNPLGIDATIDEVTYTGSIITDASEIALIVYPAAAKGKAKAPVPPMPQPMSRLSKRKPPAPTSTASGGEEHGRLEVGDVLDGFEVAEILPNKLVFTKGEERVEKLLHDPAKQRKAPPPRAAATAPGGPPSQAGGPATPAGVRSTTIGGAAQPMPATASTPAMPGQPAQSRAPVPGAPVPGAPAAITRPVMPGAPASRPGMPGAQGAQPSPMRRMVLSRKAAPAPNTSRVLRRAVGPDADLLPTPPGMIPSPGSTPMPAQNEE